MTDVTVLLKQFTWRYRAALTAKASVLGALALGVAGACWWRLHLLRVSPWWEAGVPAALALVSVTGLGWWLRQRWISAHAAADHLDKTLGLQQRLVTTLEFARTTPPPALYPLLVDDTTHAFAAQNARVPRPLDRTAGWLAVVLLLLLCWPFKGTEPIRLANLPGMPPSTPPQPDIPPPPRDQHQDQEPRSSSGQQDSPHPSSGGSSPQPQSGADQQDRAGGSGASPDTTQQAQGTSSQDASAGDRTQRADGRQGRDQQQGTEQANKGRHGQSGKGAQQTAAAGTTAEQAASRDISQQASSSGGAQRLGNQDALKADIQQLLKELSGELKDLQQQLAAAEVQAREAGTSTDAQLYGAPEALERPQGSSVPIQLKTDTKDTTTTRPGGGVGQPSGEISSAVPQAESEAAALAEESLEETAVTRQRVPPEYQRVFDRLYQRTEQPRETQGP